jgi:hypothetical protein
MKTTPALGGGEHLVGDRGGEDFTGTGSVEHAGADEASVQGLVAGAAAGYQGDLADGRAAGAGDDARLGVHVQSGMGRGDPGERVAQDGFWGVDELLHAGTPQEDAAMDEAEVTVGTAAVGAVARRALSAT